MKSPSKFPPSAFIPYSDGDVYLPAIREVDDDQVHTAFTDVFE